MQVTSATFALGAVDIKGVPREGIPQVAFLGRSNVGKSSLLNALMQKKIVKTSATPGKTREINFFLVNGKFFFADLPGIGYAQVGFAERERMGERIRAYIEKARDLRGVVYLVDARHAGHAIDVETVEKLRALGRPVLVLASKRDKLSQKEWALAQKQMAQNFGLDAPPLAVSSLKKTGLDALWAALAEILEI
jgi:GTP-binding protein